MARSLSSADWESWLRCVTWLRTRRLGVNGASSYQRLREHLNYLKLDTAAENLSPELDWATKEKLSATQVLELEVEATQARRQRGP